MMFVYRTVSMTVIEVGNELRENVNSSSSNNNN